MVSVDDDRRVEQVLAKIGHGWQAGARPQRSTARTMLVMSAAVAVAVSLAACGSGSSAGSASDLSEAASSANVDAARAAIAPFIGHPSAFPVTETLAKPLPAGKKFAFLQCSTPFCALAGKGLQAAVTALGGTFTSVYAGSTAQSSQTAAASLLASKPDAVFVSVDPALYGGELRKLSAAGVKVISISITKDVKPNGVTFNYIGENEIAEDGRLLADWVVVNKGADADVVFYSLPSFDFSSPLQKAFSKELAKNCPTCRVRTLPIDVGTLGTTAAETVVADLEAHPASNVAVFASLQIAAGLPDEIKAAGLDVKTVGRGPTPANLQDIKTGGLSAGLAIDAAVPVWTAVDAAARLLTGDQPTASETAGVLDKQFLTQKDITFDTTNGWVGYPDFAGRFAKLWNPAAG